MYQATASSITSSLLHFQLRKENTILLMVLCFVFGTFGLFANTQIIRFYWGKRKHLVPALYLSLAVTDLVVSFAAFLHFVAMIFMLPGVGKLESESAKFSLMGFLAFLFCLSTIIIRMSAFVNVVLIVVRTINITKPFYAINITGLYISFVAVILVLLPLAIYEANRIWDSKFDDSKADYIFVPFLGDFTLVDIYNAIKKAVDPTHNETEITMKFTLVVNGVPLILAVLIALSCLAVTSVVLKRSPPGGATNQRREKENKVTITIAILTIIFAICTSIYTLYFLVIITHDEILFIDPTVILWTYITSTIFPFICSSVNPIILIIRSQALRQSVLKSVTWSKVALANNMINPADTTTQRRTEVVFETQIQHKNDETSCSATVL